MDIFYINCFSHSLYLSRARNISCFSCFLTIIYPIYMPKLNTSGGKGKICRMGESGLVILLAHAQCSVITEDGEQGFSKTGPIF